MFGLGGSCVCDASQAMPLKFEVIAIFTDTIN
jgi:hypothetical protein